MNPGNIYFISYPLIFLYFLLVHCDLPSTICPSSSPLSLFPLSLSVSLLPLCWFKSYWWTWLLFLQPPCSHFLTCCLIDRVLVCTNWAFDYKHPPPPAHTHTNTHNTPSLYGWGKCKSFFPLTAVISVCWQRLQKRLDKEASFPMTVFVFVFLLLSLPIHTYHAKAYMKYNNTQRRDHMLMLSLIRIHSYSHTLRSAQLQTIELDRCWISEADTSVDMWE